jgi:hypothetical protein
MTMERKGHAVILASSEADILIYGMGRGVAEVATRWREAAP